MKMYFLFFFLVTFGNAPGQTVTPIQDRANEGQMKRMVFQQWDDWQPTPETGFLGIPENPEGFLFWKILHKKYFKGGDKRPYRAGGTFEQNYASLTMQEKDDQRIRDTMQKVAETNLATYVNMSGGAADIAWSTYFGKQFTNLLTEIPDRLLSIAGKYPIAADKMRSNEHYIQYLEYLDVTTDRLKTIHYSFIDKGDRMITYLEIQKDMRYRNEVMNNMINDYIRLTKLPTAEQVKAANKNTIIYSNDRQILKHILTTFNF